MYRVAQKFMNILCSMAKEQLKEHFYLSFKVSSFIVLHFSPLRDMYGALRQYKVFPKGAEYIIFYTCNNWI